MSCFYNYYNLFCQPPYIQVEWSTPSTTQAIHKYKKQIIWALHIFRTDMSLFMLNDTLQIYIKHVKFIHMWSLGKILGIFFYIYLTVLHYEKFCLGYMYR